MRLGFSVQPSPACSCSSHPKGEAAARRRIASSISAVRCAPSTVPSRAPRSRPSPPTCEAGHQGSHVGSKPQFRTDSAWQMTEAVYAASAARSGYLQSIWFCTVARQLNQSRLSPNQPADGSVASLCSIWRRSRAASAHPPPLPPPYCGRHGR